MNENAIITATTRAVQFKSEKLNAVTREISGYIEEVQTKAHNNHIAIAKALARVNTEKLFEEDGFKSALDYAMDTFGWKRANAYAMMQVGAKLNANELPEGDFSVSQYREMLPLSKDELESAIEAGVIDSDMTAKDIRSEVEALKPKKERKPKDEKVYRWYMDGVPGKADVVLSESAMAEGNGVAWTHKVTRKHENGTMTAYLVCSEGEIRVFVRGDEVIEEQEESN